MRRVGVLALGLVSLLAAGCATTKPEPTPPRPKVRDATPEKKTRDEINDKGTTTGAAVTAIPIIGPLLAIGVAGTQMVTDSSVESEYRGYDREEENAADRYGQDLLELVIGRVRACQAEVALLERLVQARASRPWAAWLSTHPRPEDRLKGAKEHCPAGSGVGVDLAEAAAGGVR